MRFIYILIMVLLVAQGLWGITLYGLHWWLRPVLTELVRLRIWMVAGLVLANLSMLAPHYLVPARQWHWLIGLLLFAFYGFVLTLVLAALQAILIRWFPVVRVHSLVRMAVPVLVLVLLVWGWAGAYLPQVVRYQVSVDKPLAQPLRIALISDTHFGHVIGKQHIRRLADIVNKEQPDIILLAGDIMDDLPDAFIQKDMASALRKVKAPLGQYAVLGNHDNYRHVQSAIVEATEAGGFTVLRDETRIIDNRFVLVGRRDKEEQRQTPEEIITDSDMPIIVLDHQPADVDLVAQTDADIMMVGHTHAGQVFPGTLLVGLFQRYTHGHYRQGKLQLFVTSGFGLWGVPLRIGTRAEVAIIDLLP
ncbi:MAG TPA: metallophosphoesterase [Burkholderiaceae bacterium]|nr:metallophosphoesterase [Burkholderiaceae bacterium]